MKQDMVNSANSEFQLKQENFFRNSIHENLVQLMIRYDKLQPKAGIMRPIRVFHRSLNSHRLPFIRHPKDDD